MTLRNAIRTLAWTTGALLVALLVSGVYVAFRYRPDADGFALGMQRVHPASGYALVAAVIALMGLQVAASRGRRIRSNAWAALGSVAFVAVSAIAFTTGQRVAWSQVVIAEVAIGNEISGVFLGGDAVQFVRTSGREISFARYQWYVWLHILVVPLVMFVAFALAAWADRRTSPSPKPSRAS